MRKRKLFTTDKIPGSVSLLLADIGQMRVLVGMFAEKVGDIVGALAVAYNIHIAVKKLASVDGTTIKVASNGKKYFI